MSKNDLSVHKPKSAPPTKTDDEHMVRRRDNYYKGAKAKPELANGNNMVVYLLLVFHVSRT